MPIGEVRGLTRIVYVGAWGTQHHLVDSWDMTLCGIPPTRTWRKPDMQWDWDLVPDHLRCKRCQQVRPYRMRLTRFVRESPFYDSRLGQYEESSGGSSPSSETSRKS